MRRYIKGTWKELIAFEIGIDQLESILKSKYSDYTICADKKGACVNDFSTFDIETTSMDDYGFMYIAMLCVGEDVFMVRTWEEVVEMFEILSKHYRSTVKKRYVIYVHNLSFEFQFMRNFFEWERVFAVKEGVPVRALTTSGLEFRCSYKLTNMSLAKFCEKTKGVVHYKQESKKRDKTGDYFDYSILRTPDTELLDFEYIYCYCDVKGLHEGIETLLEDDNLCTIPLTSTGYVRREVRKNVLSNSMNRQLIIDCQFDSYIYTLLRTMRRGGDCTANPMLSSQVIADVDSWDIKSSYPFVMMTQNFPVGQFVPDSGKNLISGRCYIIGITLKNIRVKEKHYIGYIPFSKCTSKIKAVNCNGRVVKAQEVSLVVNEVDLAIIRNRYNVEEECVNFAWSCESMLLPREFRQTVADYFQGKCDLEGVDPYLYAKFKNKINALFGMMLTDITNPEILYLRGEWSKNECDVDAELDKYFKSRNSFLAYQWGVWVTTYARARLAEPYLDICMSAIYCDTDAWKLMRGYDKNVFKNINSRLIADAETYDVKPYAYRKDGTKEYLGVWEFEGTYEEFKTMGSKKYATVNNGKIEVTVSGLSKEDGALYLDKLGGIKAFKDGLKFSEEYSGRTFTVADNDNRIRKITVNGCSFTTSSSFAIHNTTYTLSRTGEYISLLEALKKYGVDKLDEAVNF